MVFRVADIDEMLVFPVHVAKALRMMELSFIVRPVYQADLPVSYLVFKSHCVLIDDNYSVVGSIRNNDQVSV